MPLLVQNACLDCQKVFKKPEVDYWFEATHREFYKCPDCGSMMYYMGPNFKAPSKGDNKEWERLKECIKSGQDWTIKSNRKEKNKTKRTRESR